MTKLGCFFMTARTADDLYSRIHIAERLGYEVAGIPQIAGRDPMITLSGAVARTSRIRLATGVVPIWTRTPVAMAQEAATLAELSDGRFWLGLGVGHRELIESWHGTEFRKPVTAMRDYLTIVRRALSGMVEYEGEVFRSSFAFMGFQPKNDIPLLVAALSPKMLEMSGEISDGVILWLSSPRHIRDVVVPSLKAGAKRAGRDAGELEVFSCVFAAPGPNRSSARDAVRRQLFAYMTLPHYRKVIAEAGFESDLASFDEGMKEGLLPQALAGLSDALIDSVAVTGGPEEVAETLAAFIEAGCTMPGVGVVGGYDGYHGVEHSLHLLLEAGALVG